MRSIWIKAFAGIRAPTVHREKKNLICLKVGHQESTSVDANPAVNYAGLVRQDQKASLSLFAV